MNNCSCFYIQIFFTLLGVQLWRAGRDGWCIFSLVSLNLHQCKILTRALEKHSTNCLETCSKFFNIRCSSEQIRFCIQFDTVVAGCGEGYSLYSLHIIYSAAAFENFGGSKFL